MADQPSSHRVRCQDIKLGLRIHSEILAGLEATINETMPELSPIKLQGDISHGPDPINWPPIIIKQTGCLIDAPLPPRDGLTVATAMGYMRAMLQLPWAVLSALPDDHLFDLPAAIEPLGLPPNTAGEARG